MKDSSRGSNSATAAANVAARLPDFCNMGIMLRLLVMVNVLCLAAAMVRAENLADLGSRFMTISVIAQPALILSLIATCLLRPVFLKLAYWQGIVLILLMEGAVGALMWAFFDALAALSQPIAWWQYVFFFAFVTGSVLVYFDLRSRALSPALAEARLQALQARIRPHFLFNSINAVLSLIRSEPKRAERMLEDMAELFRVLMADNRQLVPLADEIALCRRFLDIEQIRLGERLQVNWRIDAMPRDALVPPLILQPLIENAVYHGIEPASGVGELNIHIEPKGKQLVIRMTNPYQAGSTHATGNRMAIANIKERLQLHFDAEASLKADVSGDRYLVTITLPTVEKTP